MRASLVVLVTFMLCAHALGQYYDTGKDDTTPNWMKPEDAYAGNADWNKEYSNWNEQFYSSGSNFNTMQLSLMVSVFVAARFALL